jgi:hypothetical protein
VCPDVFAKYLDFPGTRTQIRFYKRQLKVHDRALNLAVLVELGKVPSQVSVLSSVINFWTHILKSSKDSLLYDAYLCNYQQLYEGSNDRWLQIIKHLCDSFPILKTFWDNHDASHLSAITLQSININLKLKGFVSFNTSGGRFSLFSKLKTTFIF